MHERRAALFDLDGTIINTHEYVFGGIEYSSATLGYPVPTREQIKCIVANPIRICYQLLFPEGDTNRLVAAHGEFQDNNPHLVVPFPEALDVLTQIKANDLVIAAVTSRRTAGSRRILQSIGIEDLFEMVVGADDVVVPKPDPEGINFVLRAFNINSRFAYMIGDTKSDIEAGKSASIHTVGVIYGFDGEDILASEPDHVVHNLFDILPILFR